ncbi:MAG: hypothetical protein PVJ92_03295 [Candidatus Dependentiae bacterium]|jgi:hypothetical protein
MKHTTTSLWLVQSLLTLSLLLTGGALEATQTPLQKTEPLSKREELKRAGEILKENPHISSSEFIEKAKKAGIESNIYFLSKYIDLVAVAVSADSICSDHSLS